MRITGKCFLAIAVSLISGAATGDVLVYRGEGGLSAGYSDFGTATGKTIVSQNTLPADLSPYECLVLPSNQSGFSAATLNALDDYVNSGGRIIAQAEHSGFPGSISSMNQLATHIGADLSIIAAGIDSGFHNTSDIDASPFTVGVTTIHYAATSEVAVAVGPNAHSLVRTVNSGTTFIGVDKIGGGVFALTGDINTLSDWSDNGYLNQDNGVLAANLCDQASFDIEVAIDIKFCSDPNAFNCKKKGVLPVTIFGTGDFDVADIDVSSLRLCTEDGLNCTNAPRDSSIADRGDPESDLGAAECAIVDDVEQDYLTLDGFLDLDAAFEASEVQDMLGTFCGAERNAVSETLVIMGSTIDGTPILSVPIGNAGIDQLVKKQ
jgi:hypothetical protein